jgi:hypothetical protein
MSFLEQIFHLWPDGGDGSTELTIVVSVLIALVFCWHARQHTGGIFQLNSQSTPKASIGAGEANANNH